MELSDRKKKILRVIVDLYIRTAEPVASKTIAQMPDMDFSSATIRNEMAELTTLGYLEQPHTSAGRIPSPAVLADIAGGRQGRLAGRQACLADDESARLRHGGACRRADGQAVRPDPRGQRQLYSRRDAERQLRQE